jgi:TM2 domain-containing membrane protein YozV
MTAAILAAVPGILLMGIGQFYVNRFVRGIVILTVGLVTGYRVLLRSLGRVL